MKLTIKKELTSQGEIAVIYRGGLPIGNFQFERYGPHKAGVNLRWRDNAGPHIVHFVGATEEGVMKQWEKLVTQHILKKNPDITRSGGFPVQVGGVPYIVGGGYQGATKTLDNVVAAEAEALSKAFGRPVEIRFNSDRESGGAWIKNRVAGIWGSTQVGLAAGYRATTPRGMSRMDFLVKSSLEFIRSRPKKLYIETVVDKGALRDPSLADQGPETSKYSAKTHPTVQAAISWLLKNVDKVKILNNPTGNPRMPWMRLLWMRLGDNAEYEHGESAYEAGYSVGQVTSDLKPRWRPLGVEIGGFTGHNYISIFWGDNAAQPVSKAELTALDKQEFVRGLREAAKSNPKKVQWKMIAGRGRPEDVNTGALVNWGYDKDIPLSIYKKWHAELQKHIGEEVAVTGGGGPGVYGYGTLASSTITKFYDGKPALKAMIKGVHDPNKKWQKPQDFDPWINSWQIWVKVR